MLISSRTSRVLVLSPHTDDAELGCGGTIARLIEEGVELHVAVFSTARESLSPGLAPDTLERECRLSMSALGIPESHLRILDYPVRKLDSYRQDILEVLVRLRNTLSPDVVFTPAQSDLHQDHQVLSVEGLRAFKGTTVMGYELPWNHIDFSANAFSDLEERHVNLKWTALSNYTSQVQLSRRYFSQDFITSLARVRGVQIGTPFAEAFDLSRLRF